MPNHARINNKKNKKNKIRKNFDNDLNQQYQDDLTRQYQETDHVDPYLLSVGENGSLTESQQKELMYAHFEKTRKAVRERELEHLQRNRRDVNPTTSTPITLPTKQPIAKNEDVKELIKSRTDYINALIQNPNAENCKKLLDFANKELAASCFYGYGGNPATTGTSFATNDATAMALTQYRHRIDGLPPAEIPEFKRLGRKYVRTIFNGLESVSNNMGKFTAELSNDGNFTKAMKPWAEGTNIPETFKILLDLQVRQDHSSGEAVFDKCEVGPKSKDSSDIRTITIDGHTPAFNTTKCLKEITTNLDYLKLNLMMEGVVNGTAKSKTNLTLTEIQDKLSEQYKATILNQTQTTTAPSQTTSSPSLFSSIANSISGYTSSIGSYLFASTTPMEQISSTASVPLSTSSVAQSASSSIAPEVSSTADVTPSIPSSSVASSSSSTADITSSIPSSSATSTSVQPTSSSANPSSSYAVQSTSSSVAPEVSSAADVTPSIPSSSVAPSSSSTADITSSITSSSATSTSVQPTSSSANPSSSSYAVQSTSSSATPPLSSSVSTATSTSVQPTSSLYKNFSKTMSQGINTASNIASSALNTASGVVSTASNVASSALNKASSVASTASNIASSALNTASSVASSINSIGVKPSSSYYNGGIYSSSYSDVPPTSYYNTQTAKPMTTIGKAVGNNSSPSDNTGVIAGATVGAGVAALVGAIAAKRCYDKYKERNEKKYNVEIGLDNLDSGLSSKHLVPTIDAIAGIQAERGKQEGMKAKDTRRKFTTFSNSVNISSDPNDKTSGDMGQTRL